MSIRRICYSLFVQDGFQIFQNGRIIEQFITEKTEQYQIEMTIPSISDMKNVELQNLINEQIQQDADRHVDELKEAAKANRLAKNYTLKANYKIENMEGIISITILYDMYLGGAHSSIEKLSYNYDTVSGKRLELSDLFDGRDYINILNNEIREQIARRNKSLGYIAIDNFTTVKPNTNFYIFNNLLVIYFQPYEIAPFAAGIVEFLIPREIYEVK